MILPFPYRPAPSANMAHRIGEGLAHLTRHVAFMLSVPTGERYIVGKRDSFKDLIFDFNLLHYSLHPFPTLCQTVPGTESSFFKAHWHWHWVLLRIGAWLVVVEVMPPFQWADPMREPDGAYRLYVRYVYRLESS